ncbi:hypothetical protein D3C80_1924050 [compost metagenome]
MPPLESLSLFFKVGVTVIDRIHRKILVVKDATTHFLAQAMLGHVRGRRATQVMHGWARIAVRDT